MTQCRNKNTQPCRSGNPEGCMPGQCVLALEPIPWSVVANAKAFGVAPADLAAAIRNNAIQAADDATGAAKLPTYTELTEALNWALVYIDQRGPFKTSEYDKALKLSEKASLKKVYHYTNDK